MVLGRKNTLVQPRKHTAFLQPFVCAYTNHKLHSNSKDYTYGSRRSRLRLSVAPASTPAASALQLSLGLNEKVGKGKLLGGGEIVKATAPENSPTCSFRATRERTSLVLIVVLLPDNELKIVGTFLGSSFGSGPKGFKFTSFLGILVFDFLGVRDESRILALLVDFWLAGGQESPLARGLALVLFGLLAVEMGRGRRGGCCWNENGG